MKTMVTTNNRMTRLRDEVRRLDGGVIVAFSGGVDSALLLKVCVDEWGDAVVAATAESPSYPEHDRQDALKLAESFGARHVFVATREMDDEAYRRNDSQRCYVCKHTLFDTLSPIARELGMANLAFGANADDVGDYRPGHRAADEFGVHAPLMKADLSKDDVRELARALGIPVWDKPASACLASRIPYGTRVESRVLSQVERAEAMLRKLGFPHCRVRHHGEVARIELPQAELARAVSDHARIAAQLKEAGYTFVALDLDGYRSGSLNKLLKNNVSGAREEPR